MHGLSELFNRLRDVSGLVQAAGYTGMSVIIFAETGLLIGFFLPGDSLLVSAGLLGSQGYIDVWLLGLILSVAAVAGDTVGYAIGKATGHHLFTREDSLLFNRKHLIKAHEFYERHGGKTILIARFMPIIRTFAPVVAGMGEMQYSRFLAYNVVGGVAWVWSMLLLGYSLGRTFPGVAKHIELIILIIVFLSILPAIIARYRARYNTKLET
ncbi:MAG TPA: VTT domain-containing protein [Gemmatimonadaceae bacterium]|nr:VTT domain-containing protein [Gemmatimonadaceae bacterium]